MQLRWLFVSTLFVTACTAEAAKGANASAHDEAADKGADKAPEPTPTDTAAPEPAAPPPTPAASGLTVVELKFDANADLVKLLAEEAGKAAQNGQRPHVEFWADWCGPCKRLEASMGDERMKKAFDGVYLVRANADEWGEKAKAVGYSTGSIPVFYEIATDGKPTGRTISGGAWAEDIPENMAPPLDAYFHGS